MNGGGDGPTEFPPVYTLTHTLALVDESAVTGCEARAHLADFNALEDAVDALLAREAEVVLAEGGATVTMAELLADLFIERDAGRDAGAT